MIDSVAGYKCVNVTDPDLSRFIKGEIMPVRDNRGDGSWRALRYEDLLFLQEAKEERRLCSKSALPEKATPKGRALNWSGVTTSFPKGDIEWPSATESGGRFMDAEIAIPTKVTTCSSSENPYGIAMPGAFPTAFNDFSPTYRAIGWEKPYNVRSFGNADDLRRAYYNVLKQTRTFVRASGWFYGTVRSTAFTHHSDGTTYSRDYSGERFLYQSYNTIVRGHPRRYLKAEWTPPQNLRYVFAKSATLLVDLHWYGSGNDGYDLIPFKCTVVNGAISIPQISIDDLVQGVCARHGIDYYANDPGYIDTESGGNIDFRDMSLIIDHDFPAEINSLDWNWEPEVG